ncbi:hypothetical protein B0T10DRAFT_219482 [Thelonectria olida]|uniref:Secreted protein n=1 Tax=Thelonectria olida TaxID=1576542 RepID=A0A9P8WEB7_9HYPO|nr:hypothetical protein B0T10DRAFT_219482 [Thelonectria olida]
MRWLEVVFFFFFFFLLFSDASFFGCGWAEGCLRRILAPLTETPKEMEKKKSRGPASITNIVIVTLNSYRTQQVERRPRLNGDKDIG